MTALLTIIVLVFITIAIWQMVKIFDLANANNENSQVANNKDNRVNGYLMLGFLAFIYIITIVCLVKWGDLPLMSNSASEHGPQIDNLMIISMVLLFIVQTITQFLLHYFAFKYKGEKGRKALFFADNDKLEFIWTIKCAHSVCPRICERGYYPNTCFHIWRACIWSILLWYRQQLVGTLASIFISFCRQEYNGI